MGGEQVVGALSSRHKDVRRVLYGASACARVFMSHLGEVHAVFFIAS